MLRFQQRLLPSPCKNTSTTPLYFQESTAKRPVTSLAPSDIVSGLSLIPQLSSREQRVGEEIAGLQAGVAKA